MLRLFVALNALMLLFSSSILFANSAILAKSIPAWIEYHDYTSADHQKQLDKFHAEGYRVLSLSLYGDTSNPRYAVILVKRSGANWTERHGMDAQTFQSEFNQLSKTGYKIALLAATGNKDAHLFAAVWEKSPDGVIPFSLMGLRKATDGAWPPKDKTTIDYWLYIARRYENRNEKLVKNRLTELIPSTIAAYGDSSDPRFAIVLEPNPQRIGWNVDLEGGSSFLSDAGQYQKRFEAHTSNWHRPFVTVVSPDHHFWGMFKDDYIGPWISRHNLDRPGLDAEIKLHKENGYFPISIQGGGASEDFRYTAIFAQNEIPYPRSLVSHGTKDSTPKIDTVIEKFMRANGLHQASVAVVQNKKLVLAKGYSLAESAYQATLPTTYFRTASVGKILTALAIQELIQDGKLTDNTKVQSILNWKSNTGNTPIDSNLAKITIKQLLQHTSGIPEGSPSPRDIATALGKSIPITHNDLREYLVTRTITNASPGVKFQYSNIGYTILARVVEKLRGTSFITALQKMGGKLGASRIRLMPESTASYPGDEARYFDAWSSVGLSQVVNNNNLVSFPYGGDFTNLYDGSGSISVSPVDLAKIIASLNVTSKNPLLTPASIQNLLSNSYGFDFMGSSPFHGVKGGYISGLQSMVNFSQNGLSYLVFWDRNEVDMGFDQWYPEFPELVAAIQASSLPLTDHFPDFSIPSF